MNDRAIDKEMMDKLRAAMWDEKNKDMPSTSLARWAVNRICRLEAIIARLPVTKDGVAVVPVQQEGMGGGEARGGCKTMR